MEKSRGDWLDQVQADMTWATFEHHSTQTWNKLQKVCGPTMKKTAYYQQAQLITQDAFQAIQQDHALMFQQADSNKDNILKVLQVVTTENFIPERKLREHKHKVVKVTTQDKFQLKMLKIPQNIEPKLSNRSLH